MARFLMIINSIILTEFWNLFIALLIARARILDIFIVQIGRTIFWLGKDESKFNNNSIDIAKPANFDLMCEVSKKIASDYPYVRIDLYNVDGEIFLRSLFFKGGFDRIFPYEKDLELGDKIILEHVEEKNDYKNT